MFQGATTFNQDIRNWDVSQGDTFSYMFNEATSFNQDIGGWDVSNGSEFDYMFCNAFDFNQDLSSWPPEANLANGFCSEARCQTLSSSLVPSLVESLKPISVLSPSPSESSSLVPSLIETSKPSSVLSPSPSEQSSLVPSLIETSKPSSVLSHLPSELPKECNQDEMLFQVNLRTDLYGEDTSWILQMQSRGNYWDLLARNGIIYDSDSIYRKEMCIPKDKCFMFVISDAAHDGLCCSYSNGHYSIFLDDEMVKYSIYANAAQNETTIFGTNGRLC